MRLLDEWADRKYLAGQDRAHLVPFGQQYGLCGAAPLGPWYGTGSWDEIEQAQSLPTCPGCADAVPADVTPSARTDETAVSTWQDITRRKPW